ncbi:outward-rectifier potassium channel TOK1 [Dichotomopilus funicola]|uniref:Outward-rectifier potassium channel TOK1 n=1 Tax=Dichotomopilus funicola TaxID=1934379 RepID=A0AAN6VAM0_9PEZI|nr:outward-rectifier potassium channel TOK1 [Dichotomopilus funicola]
MNEYSDEIGEHVPGPSENEFSHLKPSRWWFASSAFPMIAGTLGPVASAFSICALVRPWRQRFPPGTDITKAPYVMDPTWLTAINAIQLFIAIVANMSLLLNMTRRLSFTIAQPVTIVGWYVSALTLIALTGTGSGPLQLDGPFVWSQAFYYAIYSAILYFVIASLMVITYLGAHTGKYPKDFLLTSSQRTLMLQTIMFLVYLLVGALVFSTIEGWSYLDAVYWAAVTLFTVGFGDLYAQTTLGRALLLPYAFIGIISLGLVIGSIRSLVLDRGKRRLGARMMEKKRRRTLRRMTRKGQDDILVPIIDDNSPLSKPSSARAADSAAAELTEFERREREFNIMREIQEVSAHRRRWVAMGVSTSTWLVLWLVGAKVFQLCEQRYQQWSYFDGFYFSFVSLTTIGYGDVTPISNAGKSFWVFWALLALPTMTVLISNAGDTIVKGIRDATDQIATVTILPSEQGFKKDLRKLLGTLSFGVLFKEDIESEPTGFLGQSQRLKRDFNNVRNAKGDEEAQETMHQAEADIESESAETAAGKLKRARRTEFEEGHEARAETNAAEEEKAGEDRDNLRSRANFPHLAKTTSSPGPRQNNNHPHGLSLKHTNSIPRERDQLPLALPDSPHDYHITLIDEIRRVTQHLKHQPPRKYSFHEWAWYLRLIGEDEADAGRHRRAQPPAKQQAEPKTTQPNPESDKINTKETNDQSPWSWVGARSPLMGSQEEAEWILERLIARLGKELRGKRRDREREREREGENESKP